jgi:peptidoglycan/xylan/chitin deacetylase (PgdA/CDA1 family)
MLAVLMFHQVYEPEQPKRIKQITQFLEQLTKKYPIVKPGQTLKSCKLNVCLTFDDAYYDFYKYVFPLLIKLNIPATLAVPVQFILDSTDVSSEKRLGLHHGVEMDDNYYQTHAPFCTWQELQEMVDSGLVTIASHGYHHRNLTETNIDIDEELVKSQQTLEEKLTCSVSTFIYPYGKYSNAANQLVNKLYKFSMRIGSALNKNWHNSTNVIYRVDADHFWKKDKSWTFLCTIKFYLKYLSNIFRKR